MILGRGQNASGVAQTLGRATGNCRDVLGDNGFDCVKVLTTSNDLIVCIKMNNYINEIGRRMGQGDTIFQAMTGATVTMPDDANFARHTFRYSYPVHTCYVYYTDSMKSNTCMIFVTGKLDQSKVGRN